MALPTCQGLDRPEIKQQGHIVREDEMHLRKEKETRCEYGDRMTAAPSTTDHMDEAAPYKKTERNIVLCC